MANDKWLFLEIDVPVCTDFIRHEEQKIGRVLGYAEAIEYVAREFHFAPARAKQIVDTIKGEPKR